MSGPLVSVGVLSVSVLLGEASRRAAARLPRRLLRMSLLEAASTFQLCCCSHELKLLGDTRQLAPPASLTLTFIMTVVHVLTFRGASCNPCGVLEQCCRGGGGRAASVLLIACQFAAAFAARSFAACVWSLGLSDAHVTHRRFGFRCFDPFGGTVLEAAAAELVCAFVFQAAVMNAHKLDARLRVPYIAAVVTVLVYTAEPVEPADWSGQRPPCSGSV
ncbi:aquaporin-11-like isoform X2 [Antennarius striatus]|uniref:aquaporin-11-like isoform X2 n=1 Tax=Antennarius striatus TaxID=241820 RepID=UPI0035B4DD4A